MEQVRRFNDTVLPNIQLKSESPSYIIKRSKSTAVSLIDN
jgi:hypothetical protein